MPVRQSPLKMQVSRPAAENSMRTVITLALGFGMLAVAVAADDEGSALVAKQKQAVIEKAKLARFRKLLSTAPICCSADLSARPT